MRLFTLLYGYKGVFERVKRETSQYGVRQAGEDGASRLGALSLDEENEALFEELFRAAGADLEAAAAAYMKWLPDETVYIDSDKRERRDIRMTLLLPDDFNRAYGKPIDEAGGEYLVAHIVYRWLETKDADAAMVFYVRAERALSRFRSYLGRTQRYHRRPLAWY